MTALQELDSVESAQRVVVVDQPLHTNERQNRNPWFALEVAPDRKSLRPKSVPSLPDHSSVVERNFVEKDEVVVAPIDVAQLFNKTKHVALFDVFGAPLQHLPCQPTVVDDAPHR